MDTIENRTFDEIQIGDNASLVHRLTKKDIELFAVMSGDVNPAHVDEEYARSDHFHRIIAHGMWGGAMISTLLGTKLPGPGSIYLEQSLKFEKPIAVGDVVTVSVKVLEKNPETHRVSLECKCTNQRGEEVIVGTAKVLAPNEKIKRARIALPEVHLYEHGRHLRQFIEMAHNFPPIPTAVIHPVDVNSLRGAIDAAKQNLIVPIFIGPRTKIHAVGREANIDLSSYEIVSTKHSHEAADQGVALARAGKVEALMKGSLHTDELMHAVLRDETGLRTKRRMSHIFVLDVPEYPRPLLLTDAVVNIYPDLEDKQDIVQNAIDLARILGILQPKVAILSAVETVTPKLRSSLEAAALCKMADRGQISGGIVDGPLAFDYAVSEQAAKAKKILSPVAGRADILVVPDLESGNMLAKQLEYLADAQSAGIVVGAAVPIALTSRANDSQSKLASCAFALLMAHSGRKSPGECLGCAERGSNETTLFSNSRNEVLNGRLICHCDKRL